MCFPDFEHMDKDLKRLSKYVLDKRRYAVKVYAKGCDAPGCTQEAEVDRNLGRPVGWFFVTVAGPIPQPPGVTINPDARKTVVLCAFCYAKLGLVLT